jgi:hypothetical protein
VQVALHGSQVVDSSVQVVQREKMFRFGTERFPAEESESSDRKGGSDDAKFKGIEVRMHGSGVRMNGI